MKKRGNVGEKIFAREILKRPRKIHAKYSRSSDIYVWLAIVALTLFAMWLERKIK